MPRGRRDGGGGRRGGRGGGAGAAPRPGLRPKAEDIPIPDGAVIDDAYPFGPDDGFTVTDGITHVDGSVLEGGGQILRNSMSLASLFKRPLRVHNVRAHRSKPGLKAQHLAGVQLVSAMHRGSLRNAALHAEDFEYTPQEYVPMVHTATIGTAGSVALVVQVAMPCLVFASEPSTTMITGGTNVAMSPQIDYLVNVFRPVASRMGIDFDLTVRRRGYFPKGGGEVELQVRPPAGPLTPIVMVDRGAFTAVHIWVHYAGSMPEGVAGKVAEAAREALIPGLVKLDLRLLPVTTEVCDVGGSGSAGCGVIVTATTANGCVLAGSALLERGHKPERTGRDAAAMLLENMQHGGCVDEYLADQLIIYMALAAGRSEISTGPVSMHTKTSIFFASHFTGAKFAIRGTPKGAVISCEGVGLSPAPSTVVEEKPMY